MIPISDGNSAWVLRWVASPATAATAALSAIAMATARESQ